MRSIACCNPVVSSSEWRCIDVRDWCMSRVCWRTLSTCSCTPAVFSNAVFANSSSSSSTFTTFSSPSSSSSTAFAFPFPLSFPFLTPFPFPFSITSTCSTSFLFPFPFLLSLALPFPFFFSVPSPRSETLCGCRLLATGAGVSSSSSTSIDDSPPSSNCPCEYASRRGAVNGHCCLRWWQCSHAKRGGPLCGSTKLRHPKPPLIHREHLGLDTYVGHLSFLSSSSLGFLFGPLGAGSSSDPIVAAETILRFFLGGRLCFSFGSLSTSISSADPSTPLSSYSSPSY